MRKDETWFADIANRIVQHDSIDFDALKVDLHPEDRARLERLRVLAEVSAKARSSRSGSQSSDAGGPDAHGSDADGSRAYDPDAQGSDSYRSDPSIPGPEASIEDTLALDHPDTPDFPEQWGHLALRDQLGSGAHGTVFRAHDPRLDLEVAVKLIPDPNHEASYEEAQKLARVRHNNVLLVHGVEHRDGWLGMWTELLDGLTLEQLLKTTGRMSALEASAAGTALARALSAVHGAGLTHGDIKCANVMREVGGRIVLMDFGLASDSADVAQSSRVRGTPHYMAPELFDGHSPTPRSDIFSVGVVLFRLATGRYPIDSDSIDEIIGFHRRGDDLPSLYNYSADLPDAFVRLVAKCLSRDPHDRYETAGQLAADLSPLTGDDGATSGLPGRDPQVESGTHGAALGTAIPGTTQPSAPAPDPTSAPGQGETPETASETATGQWEAPTPTLTPPTPTTTPTGDRFNRGLLALLTFGALLAATLVLLPQLRNPSGSEADEPNQTANLLSTPVRLVVLGFDNLVDPADSTRIAAMIPSLLTTDLSQSKHTQVVSMHRVYEILNQMGREGEMRVDPTLAVQVAESCTADRLLTGSIVQLDPNPVVVSQLIDVGTGDILHSDRIEGDAGGSVFELADQVSRVFRPYLREGGDGVEEYDPDLSTVTTSSPVAYAHYTDAIKAIEGYRRQDTVASLESAVEADSGFALAWFELANWTRDQELAAEYAAKAIEAAEARGSWQLRLLARARHLEIEGRYDEAVELAELVLDREPDNWEALLLSTFALDASGRQEQSLQLREHMAALYPRDKVIWNDLAYSYARLDRFDEAFEALAQYRVVAPDEANSWDSEGEFRSWLGQADRARTAFDRALLMRPGWSNSQRGAAAIDALVGDYEQARERFASLAADSRDIPRVIGRTGLALIPSHQGKFLESIGRIDAAVEAAYEEGVEDRMVTAMTCQAHLLAELGEFDRAIEVALVATKAEERLGTVWAHESLVTFYAYQGKLEEAAHRLEILRERIPEGRRPFSSNLISSESVLAEAQGQFDRAIERAEASVQAYADPWNRTELGRLYVENNRSKEAIPILEEANRRLTWDRFIGSSITVFIPYYLGRAYEAQRRYEDARASYNRFLTQLKDADTEFPEVADARKRLGRLPG